MPPLSPEQKWLRVLLALASLTAVITWGYFHFYVEIWSLPKSNPLEPSSVFAFTLASLTFSLPILCFTALVIPRRWSIAALATHAAALSVLIYLIFINYKDRDFFDQWFIGMAFLILMMEMGILSITEHLRRKRKHHSYPISPQTIFDSTFFAILCGWVAGVYIWSLEIPFKVSDAAHISAKGQPYCLESADGDDITSRFALNALNLYNPSPSTTGTYHALLVIGEGEERQYMNWSYRKGTFEYVGNHAWGTTKHCSPESNFIENLPFFF